MRVAPDVFLSYAREDEGQVRALAAALEQRGYAVFWDRRVPPGQTWHEHIGGALAAAKCVVVAWSPHAVRSHWVIEEANEGRRRNALIPVLLEAVEPPFGFRGIQAASLVDWRPDRNSPVFEDLLGAIERLAGARPRQEALPPRSPGRRSRPVIGWALGLALIAGVGGTGYWWSRDGVGESGALPPEPSPVASLGSSTPASPTDLAAAPYRIGSEFRDCERCPVMVVVPAGSFVMGSPGEEEGRDADEGPQHRVTFDRPFAVGKYEVTFAQWEACVAAGGCDGYRPDDVGWGRDGRPVVNLAWEDAKAYVAWLRARTGAPYRLLTEAEWEYAARAGTTTRFWWGDEITPENANYGKSVGMTRPVGSYPANPWGLHDMNGNVWEWVEDCWHASYDGAPDDGRARTDGNCDRRGVRGGSWYDEPKFLRAAIRVSLPTGERDSAGGGFRVARSLAP
jgi:formylglycine-generating enzyme required for sulfatase activity